MPIAYEHVMAMKNIGQQYQWSDRDVMLYACGIGLGGDPLNAWELPFVNETFLDGRELKVVPTFASTAVWGASPGDIRLHHSLVLDGERDIIFHRPMPVAARVTADSTMLEVLDKGVDKGAVVTHQTVIRDEYGGALATLIMTRVARGDGGFGGPVRGGRSPHQVPARVPDRSIDIETSPNQALLYRLNGDRNALHSDPEYARKAGFERPILHGMCTYGITCRGVLQTYADYDPSAFRQHTARFSAPVVPGDTVTMHLWQDGPIVSFEAIVKERGVTVIRNGRTVLS